MGGPNFRFETLDLFDLPDERAYDAVLAIEVLEHLRNPGPYIEKLCRLTRRYLLVTVPHEPWFRLGNLARGRDLRRLGNHPEHVQNWTARTFSRLMRQYVRIREHGTVFPFQLLMGEAL